jgi:O-methyltransferase
MRKILTLLNKIRFASLLFNYSFLNGLINEKIEFASLKKVYHKFKDYTMIPEKTYLDNLRLCRGFKNKKGVVVECGVWRGGMTAGISEILGNDFEYYLFDSFEGLPQAQDIDGKAANAWQQDTKSPIYFDNCKAEIDFAINAMKLSNCSNYHIVKGWFKDTLPGFNFTQPINILRLDGDWYESTMQCLENLYPKLAQNGLIIIDDYYAWDGCTRAVHDYLSKNELPDRINQTKNGVCYIIKNGKN